MAYDFALETKLLEEAPDLHTLFTDNVLCCQNMLIKYKSLFPLYTDHTSLHSLEVIAFCNELVGENISKLNCDEIFVLLMSAYLHDTGMGISSSDYEEFAPQIPNAVSYMERFPNAPIDEVIRTNHNEFSAFFIEKHNMIFEFPSKEHLYAIKQASRGHRRTNLFDETEYPSEIVLDNGNIIHLPYIASLIRLADELDIAQDRNIQFLYDVSNIVSRRSVLEFKKHMAIKQVEFTNDALVATVDFSDEDIRQELYELFEKLNETLEKCVNVIKTRTPFKIYQTKFVVKPFVNETVTAL